VPPVALRDVLHGTPTAQGPAAATSDSGKPDETKSVNCFETMALAVSVTVAYTVKEPAMGGVPLSTPLAESASQEGRLLPDHV